MSTERIEDRGTLSIDVVSVGTGEVELEIHPLRMPTAEELGESTNDELIEKILDEQDAYEALRRRVDAMKMTLQRRMEWDEATLYPCEAGVATLEAKTTYDYSKLIGLFELVSEQELTELEAYTPEAGKFVSVPATWNMTKTNMLKKRGREYADIIEGAKVVSGTSLKVKRPAEGKAS